MPRITIAIPDEVMPRFEALMEPDDNGDRSKLIGRALAVYEMVPVSIKQRSN